jgi:hypothetical protein
MEQWCWLERNLGLDALAATKKCQLYNFTGAEPAPIAVAKRTEWLASANAREEQRKECRRRMNQQVCELTFRGKCPGTPAMSSTSKGPRVVQYAARADGPAMRRWSVSSSSQQVCRRRAEAWQRTCGSDARVSGRLVAAKSSAAECGGKWQQGGVRLVHPPPPPPPPQPVSAVAATFQGMRPARTPDPFPVYKPTRCDGSVASRIPSILWQTGRGKDRRAHNNASASAAGMARALIEGGGLRLEWHNDSAARAFVAAQCPRALRAYDCLRPNAYKARPRPASPDLAFGTRVQSFRPGLPPSDLRPRRVWSSGGSVALLRHVASGRHLLGCRGRAPRAAAIIAPAVRHAPSSSTSPHRTPLSPRPTAWLQLAPLFSRFSWRLSSLALRAQVRHPRAGA